LKLFPKLLFAAGIASLLVIGSIRFFAPLFAPPQLFMDGGSRTSVPPLVPDTPPLLEGDPRLLMQVGVSLILLPATLFVILSSRYQPKDKHWAYSTLGMVIGFWLKT
jgi:hypothetical protein